jgi:hypothetical protein
MMRTHTIALVEFDSVEFQMLNRVEPSIRIAFPDVYDRDKRDRGGRWLLGVAKTKQQWDAKAIHGAWDACVTLVAVLEAQSDRAYWERELLPPRAAEGAPAPSGPVLENLAQTGAIGLVAPGTDVCGMLAESRGAQLREARDALAVLEAARDAVGPLPDPSEPLKYAGV